MKIQEYPFHSNTELHWGKADFIPYPLSDAPFPIYLDKEMKTLVEKATIDMEKRGMYKFLSLTY
ncbi:MAG: hypothetical protein K9W44_11315 [Candidatus Lokiarchaeota archaeon]|nr:hypothetical protein [Candidatus Harpocratesius repetitus]